MIGLPGIIPISLGMIGERVCPIHPAQHFTPRVRFLLVFPLSWRLVDAPMGHNKGKDNAKKRAARRKKTERLAAAKPKAKA